MPVAIHTRYMPATDHRSARVRASIWRGNEDGKPVIWSVTVTDNGSDDPHLAAARLCRDQYFPDEALTLGGSTLDGRGSVFTIAGVPV